MTSSAISSASREKQLLFCCARREVNPETAARIRELAAQLLDWDYVVSQADEHSIIPLLERSLRRTAAPVPTESAAKIELMARENAMRCLALSAELIRVMELFETRAIPAIPYKGPVIAAQAYRDIAARQFEDLDIVVRQRDIQVANDAIRALGYEPRSAWLHGPQGMRIVPGEYNYSHPARRTFLEVHTEATLRHFPVRPDLDEFFRRAVKVDVGGHEVSTFCAEDALLALCVHGAKDFWQRLMWIVDIAELLRSYPALDWDLVLRTSQKMRAQRMLHLGLALAEGIVGAELAPEIRAAVKADSRAVSLAADIKKRLLSRDTPDRSAAERFRFRRRMVQGTLPGWLYAMRLTLAPAEEDWQNPRAPRQLSPLHAALRPFRLLRKYGWMNRA